MSEETKESAVEGQSPVVAAEGTPTPAAKEEPKEELKKEETKEPEKPQEPGMPLFMADTRFALLRKKLLTEFQNKFIKFFRKIPPGHAYKANQEIAAWLASFVFENLRCTHEAFKTGPEDLQVFFFVFKALASKSELMPKPKTAEEVKEAMKETATAPETTPEAPPSAPPESVTPGP